MELFTNRKCLSQEEVALFFSLTLPPLWMRYIYKYLTFVFSIILRRFYRLYLKQQNTHNDNIRQIPLTTRYLSMACTKARGSIFTGPPFHCFTLAQSGCLCSWHFNWCVLKNFKACDPLLREKLKIICEKKLLHKESNNHNCIKSALK